MHASKFYFAVVNGGEEHKLNSEICVLKLHNLLTLIKTHPGREGRPIIERGVIQKFGDIDTHVTHKFLTTPPTPNTSMEGARGWRERYSGTWSLKTSDMKRIFYEITSNNVDPPSRLKYSFST